MRSRTSVASPSEMRQARSACIGSATASIKGGQQIDRIGVHRLAAVGGRGLGRGVGMGMEDGHQVVPGILDAQHDPHQVVGVDGVDVRRRVGVRGG